jgi:hypothetical protein
MDMVGEFNRGLKELLDQMAYLQGAMHTLLESSERLHAQEAERTAEAVRELAENE